MKPLYSVQMSRRRENGIVYRAAASLDIINEADRRVVQELKYVELDYTLLVMFIREVLSLVNRRHRGKNPLLFWFIGDSILRFLERLEDTGFYLADQNRTIARDTGVSKSSIGKILAFRRKFPKPTTVDQSVPWTKYRENRVAVSG